MKSNNDKVLVIELMNRLQKYINNELALIADSEDDLYACEDGNTIIVNTLDNCAVLQQILDEFSRDEVGKASDVKLNVPETLREDWDNNFYGYLNLDYLKGENK